jgi:hypothetical protein
MSNLKVSERKFFKRDPQNIVRRLLYVFTTPEDTTRLFYEQSRVLFSRTYMKYSILYLAKVSNGSSFIYEFPFTSQTHTHIHTYTRLCPHQPDKHAVHHCPLGCNHQHCAALCSGRDTVSSQYTKAYSKCKYYNAYKKFHILHSLIYPLPIFTCQNSFAGYCNCVQSCMT